jgi:signal recognition particle receptor subunit beta
MLEHFHAKKRDVTAAIADLSTLATRVGAKSLGARVDADLVQKLQADRFHLVVVGEFNHGKTTFVNALLGGHILPTGVTPTTACIHHLEFAETPSAAVVKQDGSRKEIPFDEVRRYVVGADGDPESVKHLEVFFPAKLLQERVVLVDTPGVNDLSLTRTDITYSYIPKSDAVLFLLDAGQPLKESERVFLQEKLLAASRNKIVFVVTKRDIWDEAEEKEALAYIRNEIAKIVPNAPVFPVSSERALEGKRAESGIDELTAHLTTFLAEERGRILLDNALGEALDASKMLSSGVDARRRAAQMTGEELVRRIDKLQKDLAGQAKTIEERRGSIREEVAAIKAWVKRDLDHFAEDVAKQIPPMVDGATADEIKTHLGPFLERTFVEFAQKESKEVATALETLAEKTIALVREDAHDAAKKLGGTLGADVKAPTVEVDTLKYDVGVVALFSVGFGLLFTNLLLGGLLTAAAPLLAIYVKGRVEKETREKARELAPKVVREAASKLGPKLEQMIDDFAGRLDAWVVTAGEEMWKQVIEILTKAHADREAGTAPVAETLAACDAQAAELEKARQKLEDLRKALWAGAPAVVAEAVAVAGASGAQPIADPPNEVPKT